MAIGLIVIGDEIMSGKQSDSHFSNVTGILGERGLSLGWAHYLGDEPDGIVSLLKKTFASQDIVFCCGGIGATPDDHTRQCASIALGRPLVLHPQAKEKIRERIADTSKNRDAINYDAPENLQRLKMGEFPQGAAIIPNPVNKIPGFSYGTHYFVPGFPQMAKAMIAWALDTYHGSLFHQQVQIERSVVVHGLVEAKMTPLMEQIESQFPAVRVFSLPHMGSSRDSNYVEIGIKGSTGEPFDRAYAKLVETLDAMGMAYRTN